MTDRIKVVNKDIVFDSVTGFDPSKVWVSLYHDDTFCRHLNSSEWAYVGLNPKVLDKPQIVSIQYGSHPRVLTCTVPVTLKSPEKQATSLRLGDDEPRDAYTPPSVDRTQVAVSVLDASGGLYCRGGKELLRVGADIKSESGWEVYYVPGPGVPERLIPSSAWVVGSESPSIPCVAIIEIGATVDGAPMQCRRTVTFANVETDDGTIHIIPSVLPVAYIGQEYTARVDIEAAGDYATSVSGNFPAGLSVVKNEIRGIPAAIGDFSFTLTATVVGGQSDSANFSLSVKSLIPGEAPRILGRVLAPGMVGQYYEKTIEYAGSEPISWTASGLPAGLHIDNSGAVSGVPTAAFSGMFHVTAKNAYGTTESDISLTIAQSGDAPHILTPSLPEGVMYASYRAEQRVEGMEPISWTASGLPAGLQIFSATGAILGVPTQLGTFNVTLRAANAIGSDEVVLPLVVRNSAETAPRITTESLQQGRVGVPYGSAMAASGYAPISWYATNLPRGLSISRDTGFISGTPTAEGEFSVVVTATNAYGQDTKTFVLSVSAGGEGLVLVPHKRVYAYGERIQSTDLDAFYNGVQIEWKRLNIVHDPFMLGKQTVNVFYNRDPYHSEGMIEGSYEVECFRVETKEKK